MNRLFAFVVLALMIGSGCTGKKEITDYVDPFIGTDGHGHVFSGGNPAFWNGSVKP